MSVTVPAVALPPGTFFSLADLGLPVSASDVLANWLTAMQAAFPGYQPNPASIEYIQAQIFASWRAELGQLCTAGSTELFRQFGASMLGQPYENGDSALAVLTVTAADNAGYTLPLATQFTLTLDGTLIAFQTTAALTIPQGSTYGNVVVGAVAAGSAANGASAPVALVTQVNWVSSVTLVTSASGGADQEDDDQYVQRLAQTLTTLGYATPTAADMATRALDFVPAAGTDQTQVGRATAIDGYSPASSNFTVTTTSGSAVLAVTSPPASGVSAAPGATISGTGIPAGAVVQSSTTTSITMSANATASATGVVASVGGSLGNERTVTVAVTDTSGNALDADTLNAVQAYLATFREMNFVINVVSPAYTIVYVAVSVVAQAGVATTTVQANVQAALLAYLAPANFGLPQGAAAGWVNSQSIYQSRVLAVIQQTSGVDHVVDGTLALGVAASPTATTDLVLDGGFPLPTSTTTSIPLSAITVTS